MTTSTPTRIKLDTPFFGARELSRVAIVAGRVAPRLDEIVKYDEPWPDDRPFEWQPYDFFAIPEEAPAVDELSASDVLEVNVAPVAEIPEGDPRRAAAADTAGRFFAGDYDDAVASLELHSYPSPLEQLSSIRNVSELWSLSANEAHLLSFLLSRANGDWLVRVTTGWLSDYARINKDSARVALDELERKGYVRRLRSPLPKQPLILCLRPLGYREEGDRPERWRPPANPARKRGSSDSERIKKVSAAIDAAEGRIFDR